MIFCAAQLHSMVLEAMNAHPWVSSEWAFGPKQEKKATAQNRTISKYRLILRAIVPQIVDCPAVFNDQEWDPLLSALFYQYRYSKDQSGGFDDPEEDIEQFLMAGVDLVIGDVS